MTIKDLMNHVEPLLKMWAVLNHKTREQAVDALCDELNRVPKTRVKLRTPSEWQESKRPRGWIKRKLAR